MLFDTKISKNQFQLGYVGKSFEDAASKREKGIGYSELTKITNRKTNEITAKELENALLNPNDEIRKFARNLVDNRKVFLVDVCSKDCKRRSSDCDAIGVGSFKRGNRIGGVPYFDRRIGNDEPTKCNNPRDHDKHFCPTTSSNSYAIENKISDGKRYFLADQFTINIRRDHGMTPNVTIYQHRSKLTRAPGNMEIEERKRAIARFSAYSEGSINLEDLSFRRTRGYEKPQTVNLSEDGEFKLVMRQFQSKSKECRFFVGKNNISDDNFNQRGIYEEKLLYSRSGYIPLNLERDQSILVWVSGGYDISKRLQEVVNEINDNGKGITQIISDKEDFAYNYFGCFVFFENAASLRTYSGLFFGHLEKLGVMHRRARPSITERPNWMSITWHPSNTPELYRDKDSWEIPRPNLISKNGHLDLMLTTRVKSSHDRTISISVKGDGIQQKGNFNLDEYNRLFISLKFPKIGNYVVFIEHGTNFRVIEVYVTGLDQGSMISITYSDKDNQWTPLPNFKDNMEPVKSTIALESSKKELISHHLKNYFSKFEVDLSNFEGYSREHVLREISRLTFHEHLTTWVKDRNRLYSLLLDEFSPIDPEDERAIGEYIKEDLVSYGISRRTSSDDKIQWELKKPSAQKIHGINSHYILHDPHHNKSVEARYKEVIIDKKTGIRFLPTEIVKHLELPIFEIRPDLDEMIYSNPDELIEEIWKAGEHKAEKLPTNNENYYVLRWNGAMNFTKASIKNLILKISPNNRYEAWSPSPAQYWLPKNSFRNVKCLKKRKKLYFLQLTCSKEKQDQDHPWKVHLGAIDFSNGIKESGILLSAESLEMDRQLVSWIDSVGITNGLEDTKIELPWFSYPRDSKAGDSPYLLREVVRAFVSMNQKLEDDGLGRKGLAWTLFRKNSDLVNNPYGLYRNGQLGLYDDCKRIGIIQAEVETALLSKRARRALLKRMWWKFEN